jgi:hypothetical protein
MGAGRRRLCCCCASVRCHYVVAWLWVIKLGTATWLGVTRHGPTKVGLNPLSAVVSQASGERASWRESKRQAADRAWDGSSEQRHRQARNSHATKIREIPRTGNDVDSK